MDLKELSAYLASLLRSEAEVIASFLMGVLLTVVPALSLARRLAPRVDPGVELVRKDAEIARKDSELARKDAQLLLLEGRLAISKERPQGEEPNDLPNRRDEGARARSAELESENHRLRRDGLALESTVAELRTKLAQALAEVDHYAKWSQRYDEENARLKEIGLPPRG